MSDYSNYKFELAESNDSANYSVKLNKNKIITKPLFNTTTCTKNSNTQDYDCEIIEYSLRVCIEREYLF